MRIAFYAPLKPPGHPVPSGDRAMARLLIAALERAGHAVTLASDLRAYLPDPGNAADLARLEAAAARERARIAALWRREGAPDLWFCYHPYAKSPDLIGPPLATAFGLPWVSAEASLSARRDHGLWAETQARMRPALAAAAVNIGLTARDRAGLAAELPGARLAALAPFLGIDALPPAAPLAGRRIAAVAMMRAGDKMASFRALAGAMAALPGETLAVAGDGPMRGEVEALFPGSVEWRGRLPAEGVAALLAGAALYLWPGCGEAFGLAYLEAQAAGLPVVAFATAGVPEVVGEGGLLVPEGDATALAAAARRLLDDAGLRRRMGAAGRAQVAARHLLPAAATALDRILRDSLPAARRAAE